MADLRGSHLDDSRVGKHAGLERLRSDVLHDRVDLRRHKFCAQFKYFSNLDGILRRDCGDHRCSIDPKSGERLEVRLYSSTGARVRAGNGKSFIDFHLTPGSCHTGSSHVSVSGRFRDKNHRAGGRGRRTNGFERDGEGFYGLIAPGDIDMQAALARSIRFYSTDVAGRRTLRDGPDGVHFSLRVLPEDW